MKPQIPYLLHIHLHKAHEGQDQSHIHITCKFTKQKSSPKAGLGSEASSSTSYMFTYIKHIKGLPKFK